MQRIGQIHVPYTYFLVKQLFVKLMMRLDPCAATRRPAVPAVVRCQHLRENGTAAASKLSIQSDSYPAPAPGK